MVWPSAGNCGIKAASTSDREPTMIEVGDKAPAFSVPNHAGETVSLSDLAGKYVLIWWYPKADTPG